MKSNRFKQWFSILMTAVTIVGGSGIPSETTAAAPVRETVVLEETAERNLNFNMDWKFILSDPANAQNIDFDDSGWNDIQLPHDFSITQEFSNKYEAESGFLPGGTGWYRKTAIFPASFNGKSIILNFDGVYNNAYVYVNGTKIGEHHYGYTNFSFDISDLLTCDGQTENVIAVKAVNEYPSSRWYSGSGIYRDVTLTVANPIHVALDGSYVTTPDLETQKDGDVSVKVQTTVQNDSDANANAAVRTTVEDADGNIVSNANAENTIALEAGESDTLTQTLSVTQPDLWDCDNPNLYYVKTEILSGANVVDTYTTEFGFRYIDYDANTGFALNGEKMKLKGVCMHHDQGALGAAAYYDAIYRQVEKLKEMGCNSIRSSHNAPGRALLEICNELGVLVMDEVYDGWAYPKNGNTNDFSKWFNRTLGADNQLIGGSADEKWVQFALEALINRDKNDPCVIMWSIGNELNFGAPSTTSEPYVSQYTRDATSMINWIQAIDPTKPITCGDNSANFANTSDYRTKIDKLLAEAGGVVGLNYSPGNYVNNHNRQPSWPLVGSETVSSINSRGIYSTTGKIDRPGRYLYTAYDTSNVSWGQRARAAWLPVIANDFMSGTYVWTGFDYIGEPTDWNGTGPGSISGSDKAIPNSSFFGIIDTAGFPKDSYYFYTSQWKEDTTTLHIVPGCWNQDALAISGGNVPVHIYSNAAKVELFLNDQKIGTATRESLKTAAGYEYGMYRTVSDNSSLCTGLNSTNNSDSNNMAAQFNVKYAEGTLYAKAYDASGAEITDTLGQNRVTTNSDNGSILQLTAEKTEILADGSSLAYIDVDIFDKNGEFASQANPNIRFTLTGHGEIVGVDNGNQSTIDKYQQKSVLLNAKNATIDAFSGKALVIVRSTQISGGFTLQASCDGMETKKVTVNTTGSEQSETYLKDYDLQMQYHTDMEVLPTLQTRAEGTMSDGSKTDMTIAWDPIPENVYCTPGKYPINGQISCEGKFYPIVATLQVNPVIVTVPSYTKATTVGVVPILPKTTPGILPNGNTYGEYPVTWEKLNASNFSEIGSIITVSGSAEISDDRSIPTSMKIRVAESITTESKNVAPEYATLTETCDPTSDNLLSIVNGVKVSIPGGGANERWTNWNSALTNSAPTIIFTWDDVQALNYINLYYYTDDNVRLPGEITFSASADGTAFEPVTYDASTVDTNNNNKATYTFHNTQNAAALRITFKPQDGCRYVGLTECEIYTSGTYCQTNQTAVLKDLKVNGEPVPGFVANTYNSNGYITLINGSHTEAAITAEAADNASVTIIPADKNKMATVRVQSEDGETTNDYKIKLSNNEDELKSVIRQKLDDSFVIAEAKNEALYTPETWALVTTAMDEAKAFYNDSSASYNQLFSALTKLENALNNLKTKEQAKLEKIKADLSDAVKQAEAITKDDYTDKTWNEFQTALQTAQNLLNNEYALYNLLSITLKNLNDKRDKLKTNAQEALEIKQAELSKAIKTAQTKKEEDYTTNSWTPFHKALTDAINLIADENATFELLSNALQELQDTMDRLKTKAEQIIEDKKAELSELISQASSKNEADFTTDSWTPFHKALTDAQNLIADENATLELLSDALEELQDTMDRLKTKDAQAIENKKAELSNVIAEATGKIASHYTPETWNAFQSALTNAQTIINADPLTLESLSEALLQLQSKMALLQPVTNTIQPPTENPPGNTDVPKTDDTLPKVGKTYQIKKANYLVTSSSVKGGTVTFVKPIKKTNKTFSVPATVSINKITYRVTAIAKNAFKNNKKLQKVTIGKNIASIGASAFEGDSKLQNITINTKKLKTVGKKALKGIHAKAKIKTPASKRNRYKKLLKNKGQKSSVTIK